MAAHNRGRLHHVYNYNVLYSYIQAIIIVVIIKTVKVHYFFDEIGRCI